MELGIQNLEIPKFDGHTRQPRAAECKRVNTKRIIAEILGWEKDAREEIKESHFSEDILLDGSFAIVLKYKREKDERTYPAIFMSYDIDEDWNVLIKQVTRAQNKKISFRFNSSFDSIWYFLTLIRQNFTNKWIKVSMSREWMDGAWFRSHAVAERDIIIKELEKLNSGI